MIYVLNGVFRVKERIGGTTTLPMPKGRESVNNGAYMPLDGC